MEEVGLTADDRNRIRKYLQKPPYAREDADLLPDDRPASGDR